MAGVAALKRHRPSTSAHFLKPDEVSHLVQLASHLSQANLWEQGRQGTRYNKFNLTKLASISYSDSGIVERLVQRSLDEICKSQGPSSTFKLKEWDNYLLQYPVGSYIPWHKDPIAPLQSHPDEDAQPQHWRLNSILGQSTGGKLSLEKEGTQHLAIGDALIFRPDQIAHKITPVEGSERLVWSVGCVIHPNPATPGCDLSKLQEKVKQTKKAFILGPGEVGKRLATALEKSGWFCRLVRRNDSQAWDEAVDNETAETHLRILCMREDDLPGALARFHGFPVPQNLVLVQNGDFFSVLTASPFYGVHAQLLSSELTAGGLACRDLPNYSDFLKEMSTKAIWNSIVGLPLHVHQGVSLGDYIDNHSEEVKGLIAESTAVARAVYGMVDEGQLVFDKVVDTTKNLRFMKRSGPAYGLATRNFAIQQWGIEHDIPTPITDRLLAKNAELPK